MTYLALRSSGVSPTQPGAPVYSSLANLFTAILTYFPLTDSITVYIKGGDSFGSTGSVTSLSYTNSWAGYSLIFETDPGEVSTPSTLLGAMAFLKSGSFSGAAGTVIFKKLKAGNSAFLMAVGGSYTVNMQFEDCLLYVQNNSSSYLTDVSTYGGAGVGKCSNCSIFMSRVSGDWAAYQPLHASSGSILNNNLIVFRKNGNIIVDANGATHNNNILWNSYSGGTMSTGAGTWNNTTVDQNPNTVNEIVQGADSVATMIARDARLTVASTPCIGTADAGTATATDIVGITRA